MLTLPDAILPLLVPFATLFSNPTWRKAQVLLVGAILTPGQRTVAAALRVMGRSDQRDYPATMRCSTGRCGRPVRRLASCCAAPETCAREPGPIGSSARPTAPPASPGPGRRPAGPSAKHRSRRPARMAKPPGARAGAAPQPAILRRVGSGSKPAVHMGLGMPLAARCAVRPSGGRGASGSRPVPNAISATQTD